MSRFGNPVLVIEGQRFRKVHRHAETPKILGKDTWLCIKSDTGCRCYAITHYGHIVAMGFSHQHNVKKRKRQNKRTINQSPSRTVTGKSMRKKPIRMKKTLPNPFVDEPILNGVSFGNGNSLNSDLSRFASYFN